MNLLFVHQNFPGQYRHIVQALVGRSDTRVVALGMRPAAAGFPRQLTYVRYGIQRGNTEGIHPLVKETESKLIRAEACARAAHTLREQGFVPDLICAHPGWGEPLFLQDIWPTAPLLTYQEYFYRTTNSDYDFDPELQPPRPWQDRARCRMKNANVLLSLQASRWCVSPTAFQRSVFPAEWQPRISPIHDGIDTEAARPNSKVSPLTLPDGTVLKPGEPIVTFVNRRLEPYRGCHTMLRAIPALQRRQPQARLVIVGETEGVSYGKACPKGEWKEHFLREIEGHYDPTRLHFCGSLPYESFLHLLQLSAAHVYLTYPFVLSWSLLEAMSCACPVVGSATAPVMEVIRHGHNGLLVDFFDPAGLAAAIDELLTNPERARALGKEARATVVRQYSLERCLPKQLALLELVAGGGL